jgi:GAF domain-containing protein
LLQRTIHLLGEANLGEIRLVDEERGELVVYASQGELAGEEFRSLKIGEGITGWVAQHGKPALVPDVDQDPRFKRFLKGTQSEIAVPMLSGEKVIGVLNIEHPQKNAFSEEDLTLLEAIASQAVIAIHNARLYHVLERKVKELEALSALGAQLSTVPLE